jgi:hypothetical protein
MADDDLAQLRNAYHSFGPGFPIEVRELFDLHANADRTDWCLRSSRACCRFLSAAELITDDLFPVPATWEVTHVVPEQMAERGNTVTVTGHMYCRPKGGWDTLHLPFMHVWTMCSGKVMSLSSFLDGIQLSRTDGVSSCAA